MTIARRCAISTILVLSCGSCTSNHSVQVERTQPPGHVITRIVARDQVIVVRATGHGPTYSVESAAGQVIVPAMSINELAMSNPDLLHVVRTMQADASTGAWAGL